jgi:topoisomerase-4 subunit A
VFREDGKMIVTKLGSKTFVGKNIIHAAVFKKGDKRTIYNMIYKDGKGGPTYMKRFAVTGVTRDKEYDLTAGNKLSKVFYFSANPNGEAEVVTVHLRAVGSIKKLKWDIDFAELAIKGRGTRGNTVTKYSVKRIELKEKGISTLKPRKIWFDDTVQRLNVDARGELLGEFTAEDRLLIISQAGVVKTIRPELSTHFDSDMIVLEKWIPNKPISAVHFDGKKACYYVKRFMIDNPNKEETFITDHPKSQLEIVATDFRPMAEVIFSKRSLENDSINFEEFIAIKGIKAIGNQLTKEKIKQVNLLESLPYEAPEVNTVEVVDEVQVNGDDVVVEKPTKTTKKGKTSKNNDSDDESQTSLF